MTVAAVVSDELGQVRQGYEERGRATAQPTRARPFSPRQAQDSSRMIQKSHQLSVRLQIFTRFRHVSISSTQEFHSCNVKLKSVRVFFFFCARTSPIFIYIRQKIQLSFSKVKK